MIRRNIVHQLRICGKHLRDRLHVVVSVDEILIDLRVCTHHDIFKYLTCRPALAVAKVERVFPIRHGGGELIADGPELFPCDVLVFRNLHAVFFKDVLVVEDDV